MKTDIKQVISFNLKLDSSEMIMFTKGGMFKAEIPMEFFKSLQIDKEEYDDELDGKENHPAITTKFEVTVQMQRDQQGRFDFINGEAQKHKERVANES